MSAIHLEIPEETLISLKTDPESFAQDLRMLAAVKLFELGKLSSGQREFPRSGSITGLGQGAPFARFNFAGSRVTCSTTELQSASQAIFAWTSEIFPSLRASRTASIAFSIFSGSCRRRNRLRMLNTTIPNAIR